MDKHYYNPYGGIDRRTSFGLEKEDGYFREAKNVDIFGKTLRRARGQELIYTHTSGWRGIAEHEVNGIFNLRGIDMAGNYFRMGQGYTITPVYSTFNYDPTAQVGDTTLVKFNSNETAMYVVDYVSALPDVIYQYTLSTAGYVNSANYASKSVAIGVTGGHVSGLFFDTTGTKMYVGIFGGTSGIYQYTLSTPWDISTATYASKNYTSIPNILSWVGSIYIDSSGTRLYCLNGSTKILYQYTLATPWDISTASYASKSHDGTAEGQHASFYFDPSGKKLFMEDGDSGSIYQYLLATAWDISTASYTSTSYDTGSSSYSKLVFSNDGSRFYLRNSADEKIYQWSCPDWDLGGAVKTTLSGTKPYFFNFKSNLVVITGGDDPFYDTGYSVAQTGLYSAKGVYGSCGASFHGRIFIADGNSLYWTAVNTLNDWTTSNDAGSKTDFIGTIVDLKVFGSYLMIFTTTDTYYLSGYDNTDFKFDNWNKKGQFSRFGNVELDQKIYSFYDGGLYPIEVTGDIAQVRFKTPLSDPISSLLEEVDKDRLNEVILVPYQDRKQIWCYIPVAGQTGIYKAYIINFVNNDSKFKNAWVTREANQITCACSFKGGIYTGTVDGKIYKEDSGSTFDSTAITSSLYFNEINLVPNRIKSVESMVMQFDSEYANKFTLNLVYNGKEGNIKTKSIDLSSKQDANNNKIKKIVPIKDEWRSVKIGLSTDATDEDFMLYGFSFINLRTTSEY